MVSPTPIHIGPSSFPSRFKKVAVAVHKHIITLPLARFLGIELIVGPLKPRQHQIVAHVV